MNHTSSSFLCQTRHRISTCFVILWLGKHCSTLSETLSKLKSTLVIKNHTHSHIFVGKSTQVQSGIKDRCGRCYEESGCIENLQQLRRFIKGASNSAEQFPSYLCLQISSTSLKVSSIKHFAVIEVGESFSSKSLSKLFEVTEEGTKAAAATVIGMVRMSASIERRPKPVLVIDRPFLYGIMRNDDILFIGQYVWDVICH